MTEYFMLWGVTFNAASKLYIGDAIVIETEPFIIFYGSKCNGGEVRIFITLQLM